MKIKNTIFLLAMIMLVNKQSWAGAAGGANDHGNNLILPFFDMELPRMPEAWEWNYPYHSHKIEIVPCPAFFDASTLPQADSTIFYHSQYDKNPINKNDLTKLWTNYHEVFLLAGPKYSFFDEGNRGLYAAIKAGPGVAFSPGRLCYYYRGATRDWL